MARADLHFHLLPGVDDGPATMADSVELARAAEREGTTAIVATPHVRADFVTEVDGLPELTAAVRARLADEGIGVRVSCGAELGHDMVGRLSQQELETIAQGPPGARWLLLETPFEDFAGAVPAAAAELRDRGFAVVLAHPERSAGLLGEHEDALRAELDRGTLLQVNAPSLTGGHGREAELVARRLVAGGLAELIASDAHSLERGPSLTLGIDAALGCGLGGAPARRLTDVAPARLLHTGLAVPAAA